MSENQNNKKNIGNFFIKKKYLEDNQDKSTIIGRRRNNAKKSGVRLDSGANPYYVEDDWAPKGTEYVKEQELSIIGNKQTQKLESDVSDEEVAGGPNSTEIAGEQNFNCLGWAMAPQLGRKYNNQMMKIMMNELDETMDIDKNAQTIAEGIAEAYKGRILKGQNELLKIQQKMIAEKKQIGETKTFIVAMRTQKEIKNNTVVLDVHYARFDDSGWTNKNGPSSLLYSKTDSIGKEPESVWAYKIDPHDKIYSDPDNDLSQKEEQHIARGTNYYPRIKGNSAGSFVIEMQNQNILNKYTITNIKSMFHKQKCLLRITMQNNSHQNDIILINDPYLDAINQLKPAYYSKTEYHDEKLHLFPKDPNDTNRNCYISDLKISYQDFMGTRVFNLSGNAIYPKRNNMKAPWGFYGKIYGKCTDWNPTPTIDKTKGGITLRYNDKYTIFMKTEAKAFVDTTGGYLPLEISQPISFNTKINSFTAGKLLLDRKNKKEINLKGIKYNKEKPEDNTFKLKFTVKNTGNMVIRTAKYTSKTIYMEIPKNKA